LLNENKLFIGGEWCAGNQGEVRDVINPATGEAVTVVARADASDLDRALETSADGFARWRATSPWERSKILARSARLIEERISDLAHGMTLEQGKPLLESRMELDRTVDVFEWCAAESVRTYGRLLPQRAPGFRQTTLKEPIGPVAGFSPWNFPAVMTARKIAAALGAGCSIIIKPSEEAPGVAVGIVKACQDAGVPDGVLNLVFGDSAMVSEYLIRSPIIKKISLTGSVAVGKILSRMAGELLKPATMELGGHAPVLVFGDADPEKAAEMTAGFKFRNAGQVCLGVSRIFVHESIYQRFLDRFVECARNLKVGDGMDEGVTMGPMANERGVSAMERLMADAVDGGAKTVLGGNRIGNQGCFWEPTVLNELSDSSAIMTEEPFGPIAPTTSFHSLDEVIERANSLPFGLAAYAFTNSPKAVRTLKSEIESGMLAVNSLHVHSVETPFGGLKFSGYGYEGGIEGLDAFLATKYSSEIYN